MPEDTVDARLGRIEGKQDIMLDLMREDRKRLGALEKKVWAFPGLALVALVAAKLGIPIHV